MPTHRTADELAAFEPELLLAPKEVGTLELVVRRPSVGQREVLDKGRLTFAEGLDGDSWRTRRSRSNADGSANVEMQLNVMSARMVAFLAIEPERRALAGDQLYLDLDLSQENLPAGTRLAIGEAVIEVTDVPHTGCAKFVSRFGAEAMRFVNGRRGREMRLRGLCAKVITEGVVRPGDKVVKLATRAP